MAAAPDDTRFPWLSALRSVNLPRLDPDEGGRPVPQIGRGGAGISGGVTGGGQ